eukprot:1328913-Rhodomonas_salina.1
MPDGIVACGGRKVCRARVKEQGKRGEGWAKVKSGGIGLLLILLQPLNLLHSIEVAHGTKVPETINPSHLLAWLAVLTTLL